MTLNGGAGQAFTAGGTDASHDFTNLIVTNSIAAGVTFNDSVTVTGTFTDTTGPSYLYFHAGSTFTFANISISGGAVGTRVLMHSTSNGTPWIFAVANGTPVVTYVDAEDSDARTSAGPIDATTGCLDSTGNQNWTFLAAHNINVTGSLYTSDLTNSVKVPSKPLGVSVNGGAVTTGSTDINGDYSLPITISDGQMLAIFIKGDASKGSIVFKVNTTTTDITGVAFNVGYVKLNYLTGTSITNTMLDTADSSGDADLKFSVSGTTATFATGVSMYVKAARNYVPAGNVIADGVTIYGTLNLENNSMTDHGSWDATGGTFSCSGSSTVTFDASSTGKTILTNGSNFDNVTFNNASGGWSFSDAVILNGDMTITAGALIGTNNITVNGGDVTGNGSIALTGGIFLVDGVGNFGGTTNWTFYNLTFGDGSGIATTTKTSSNIIQADSVLIIAVNQTLDASNSTWRIAGNGTPFVATGTFLQNTSTFVYSGTTANITGSTYYNLNINKVGGTETIAGSTTVQNVLNIINGTLDGSNQTLILSGSGTPLVISGTFTPSTSTVSYTGSAATNIANVTYYNLQTSNGGAGGIDSNTKVMLHYNGTNNSTIITDSAPTPNTFTSTAINSTAQYKFGTASGYFSGSTFIYAEDNNDLDFGTGNFTMDAWIRPATVAGANRIFSKGNVETTEGTYCLGYGTAWGGGTKL
ncbi:MAG: hypothetical protein NT161_03920, partial [Candidatus Nomurabacteria bacterium]|nr:hypothetical protein [Candidatus Nomurabacteria bacterium]